ncbi:MAG: hypothetical protein AAGA55_03865 [Planctomycetota bacterium]
MPEQGRSIQLPRYQPRNEHGDTHPGTRPWIGVRFACAGAYVRVYRNVQGTAYLAGCPKCGRRMRFRVGPGGTDNRFFEVSC